MNRVLEVQNGMSKEIGAASDNICGGRPLVKLPKHPERSLIWFLIEGETISKRFCGKMLDATSVFEHLLSIVHRSTPTMPIPYPKPTGAGQTAEASSSRLPDYPPSEASSDNTLSSLDSDEEEQAAMIQEEWEESLRQLEVVLSIILLPTVGKWYGRRAAYWMYARYLDLGLGKAFFGLR